MIGVIGFDNLIQRNKDEFSFAVTEFGSGVGIIHAVTVLMACGHVAQGVNGNGDPVCVVCFGIREGATVVAEKPSLEGRRAYCSYATGRDGESPKVHSEGVPSSWDLPFFSYRPERETDTYYCGCWGWD